MCTTLATLGTIANTASAGATIYNQIQNYKDTTQEQAALDSAKLMQEEAKYQKQLGIDEARLKKIEGIKEANRQKAINSANNIDANSQTSAFNLEDILKLSNSEAKTIEEKYEKQAQSYNDRAQAYFEKAKEERTNRKNNLFKFGMQGLGSSEQIANYWLNI